jgi:hypothetical protein
MAVTLSVDVASSVLLPLSNIEEFGVGELLTDVFSSIALDDCGEVDKHSVINVVLFKYHCQLSMQVQFQRSLYSSLNISSDV